jgi:carbon monoxide dehydrogenase subunit G
VPTFETQLIFKAPPAKVWEAITDFPGYGRVIPEIREAVVEQQGEESMEVRFLLSIPLRQVTYRLRYALQAPDRLAWEMIESNTLTENGGEWILKPEGEGTHVTYRQRVSFPAWMAWAVSDAAFAREMEKTLERFRETIESGA